MSTNRSAFSVLDLTPFFFQADEDDVESVLLGGRRQGNAAASAGVAAAPVGAKGADRAASGSQGTRGAASMDELDDFVVDEDGNSVKTSQIDAAHTSTHSTPYDAICCCVLDFSSCVFIMCRWFTILHVCIIC